MFQRRRLLFAWMPQAALDLYIKTHFIEEENARISEIMRAHIVIFDVNRSRCLIFETW